MSLGFVQNSSLSKKYFIIHMNRKVKIIYPIEILDKCLCYIHGNVGNAEN